MHLQIVLALSAILLCDAKLPRFKPHAQPNELPANPLHSQALGQLQAQSKTEKTSRIVDQYRTRHRREIFDSKSYESSLTWAHSERLDQNGDVIIRWVNTDSSITFRLEAKTRGYVGLGFNSARNMRGADLVVAWVDDRNGNAQILDCYGSEFEDRAIADDVKNYELISGYQNDTHTTVEFRRQLDTCDKQDFVIGDETIQILWALGPDGSDGQLPKHVKSGARPLRLLQPMSKPESIPLNHWDVRLTNLTIPHVMATLFWCKIFKVPDLPKKHHIVGYEPLIDSRPIRNNVPVQEPNSMSPVHHIVLYECAEDEDKHLWNTWAEGDGYFGPNRPSAWATCATPLAAWAIGSQGEFLPENVGIPLGEKGGVSYYMLEVHYDNQELHNVLDSSGIRVHYTSALRQHDGALLGAGVGVSALHVIPPKQKQYRTVGICSTECTQEEHVNTMTSYSSCNSSVRKGQSYTGRLAPSLSHTGITPALRRHERPVGRTLPEDGVNIVSVLLHAHGTARKISLKHIRGTQELPRISEENYYDSHYQQFRIVPRGRKFMRGDTLITECTYDSTSKDKPILGGYSANQEMCLSFILYYPRTELAGCYSMTPVKEFFETFGVKEFYGLNFMQVENIFLSSGSWENLPPLEALSDPEAQKRMMNETGGEQGVQGDDQGVGLMKELVIWEPPEFRNKSFMAHLNEMPWAEPLLTEQIEKTLYKGMHMTFCKKRDDTWGVPMQIQSYPNYTELISNETAEKSCHYKSVRLPSVTNPSGSATSTFSWTTMVALCIMLVVAR